jgi:quercetin dioxygenase-like cupin family protein
MRSTPADARRECQQGGIRRDRPGGGKETGVRNRTVPGKYTLGSWRSLKASSAQEVLEKEVIATEHLMVVRCLYEAGSDFVEHVHDHEQITIVEEGQLEITLDGEPLRIAAGQMISIVANVPHASRVVGPQPARALNIFHSPQVGANGLSQVQEAI